MIGNRRQGPDLANAGTRRSPLWLRAHFMNPGQVSAGSVMPSYKHLFGDDRGDALIAYIASLGETNRLNSLTAHTSWRVSKQAWAQAETLDSAALFREHCATCHAPDGLTRRAWQASFKRPPPDFRVAPLIYAPAAAGATWRLNQIARIIKFGLPGTDMPGHETLPYAQIAALAHRVVALPQSSTP